MNSTTPQSKTIPSTLRSGIDISFYLELQKQLFESFLFVACTEKNFGVFSIKLASLLLDAGTFFDSLSQSLIRNTHLQGKTFGAANLCNNFESKVNGDQNFTMADYRTIFEHEYQFSTRFLNLNPYGGDFALKPLLYRHETSREFLIQPFDSWKENRALDWWDAFTSLKHDRTTNLEKATLNNTIRAFGGAFLVLCFFHADYLKKGGSKESLHLFTPHHWKLTASVTEMNFHFE